MEHKNIVISETLQHNTCLIIFSKKIKIKKIKNLCLIKNFRDLNKRNYNTSYGMNLYRKLYCKDICMS